MGHCWLRSTLCDVKVGGDVVRGGGCKGVKALPPSSLLMEGVGGDSEQTISRVAWTTISTKLCRERVRPPREIGGRARYIGGREGTTTGHDNLTTIRT